MKRILILMILLLWIPIKASAAEYTPPVAPEEAQKYMPADTSSFGEGLWYIIQKVTQTLSPSVTQASALCASVIAAVILLGIADKISDSHKQIISLIGAIAITTIMLNSANTMINLASKTITEISDYGKMFLPVMTAALAAQGGVTASAALYTGTVIFTTALTSVISGLLIPLVYIYLCASIAGSAVQQDMLARIKAFTKWIIVWTLKILLYVFSGYMTITGVISGTTDAVTLKAMKIAISGVVPVIGNILSDASETVLISAGIIKNAAGMYGVLAMVCILIGPFLKIGIQYLMIKISAAMCGIFGSKRVVSLVADFSTVMGFLLAMTGIVCLFFLISTICFMRGVT